MSDYATNGLINSPRGLLVVPFVSGQYGRTACSRLAQIIQILTFQDHARILEGRIGDPGYDYGSSLFVGKI